MCGYISMCIYISIKMRLTASNDARHEERRGAALSRTMPLSHWISQAGAGRQAAAHSRGNDTALLLWGSLAEGARRDGTHRRVGRRRY